jgi:hypothetical protein
LENAPPGEAAYLALGSPSALPLAPLAGGLLGIDLVLPVFLVGPCLVDALGEVNLPISVPGGLSAISLAAGWGLSDGGALAITNTLVATYP